MRCDTLAVFRFDAALGIVARYEASSALRIVFAVSLAALAMATAIAVWLARSVVSPIRKLSSSVEAIRRATSSTAWC